jgi:hypothetical protein
MAGYHLGQSVVNWIQPHNQRSVLGFYSVTKPISKMTAHFLANLPFSGIRTAKILFANGLKHYNHSNRFEQGRNLV